MTTKYTNTTRDNKNAWQRELFATLDKQKQGLTTIVKEGKLQMLFSMEAKARWKATGGDMNKFETDCKPSLINDLKETAYHIILPTIED